MNDLQSALIAAGLVDPAEQEAKEKEIKEASERRKKRVRKDRGIVPINKELIDFLRECDHDRFPDW